MRRFPRFTLSLLVVSAALACWRPFERPRAAAQAAPAQPFEWQGVGSCAAGPCHNQGAGKRNEVALWEQDKKHAQTYRVTLFGEKSKQIVKNWKRLKTVAETKPAEESLCRYCHSMDRAQRRRAGRFSLDEGVGCEICHGPAEHWIDVHQRPQEWKNAQKWNAAKKADAGFRDLKDLTVRAQVCVDCHVGSPAASVNHDLIAAGHPRLIFEQSAYHSRMPKHWKIEDDKRRDPDFELRLWLIGQAAAGLASVELLEGRLQDPKQPWPEFAEFDCFACHHELREPSWRRERGFAGRTPGSLSWGAWPFSMPRALAGAPGLPSKAFSKDVEQLAAALGGDAFKRESSVVPAAAVAKQLRYWQENLRRAKPFDAAAARAILKEVVNAGPQAARTDWEGAAQLYLAVASLNEALTDLDRAHPGDAWKAELQKLFKDVDSPRTYRPGPIEERIKELAKKLK